MTNNLVTVTLSVPEDRLPELYEFAGRLCAGWRSGSSGRQTGMAQVDVRSAYLGGTSEHWQSFLDALAERPGEWVSWPELCATIRLTPRQASGMLGAAERRLKRRLPYEKQQLDGVPRFRMEASVCDQVVNLAGRSA